MEDKNGKGNRGKSEGQQEMKRTYLLSVQKKPGRQIIATLLERPDNGALYVDIRERVTDAGDGWNGWTRRGCTMPIESFEVFVGRAQTVIKSMGAR